jgi:hypothetical protein
MKKLLMSTEVDILFRSEKAPYFELNGISASMGFNLSATETEYDLKILKEHRFIVHKKIDGTSSYIK